MRAASVLFFLTLAPVWANAADASPHVRAMQPASRQTVLGDFTRPVFASYKLRAAGGVFYITESDLTGKPVEHRVEYTLGGRRLQHYLTTLPDGRIVVLTPSWDVQAKKWIRDVDAGNPEESPGAPFQVWNKSCLGCHSTAPRKNFDVQSLRYRTTWQGEGVACESCHGAARDHVATVNPVRLDPARGSMVCAQCHSLRDEYAGGFTPGGNYYDYFLPVLEYRLPTSDDPAFWPDGRPRFQSNAATGLWQSRCFLQGGATCTTCHAEHGAQRTSVDATCAKCHGAIAANAPAHTHHAAGSAGGSCIGCHMPRVVAGIGEPIRDHSMSIPAPENTIRHAIPNACNLCHRDRDTAWAVRQTKVWYGERSGQEAVRRADAFTAGRKGDAAAIPALLQILSERANGPWLRANAAGYLGRFADDPSAYQAVRRAFADAEPLVRATAATELKPRAGERPAAASDLTALLHDPLRAVRVNAAIALVSLGVQHIPGADGDAFERAKEEYRARAALNPDDPSQQFAAGKFSFLAGDMDHAAAAFRAALKLDPKMPAQYALGRSLAAMGDVAAARQVLGAIPRDDQQFAAAQQLLGEIAEKANPPAGEAQQKFEHAEQQYRSEYFGAALQDLDEALRLAPQASWATKARIYRAICLEKTGRAAEAEAAMQSLAEAPEAQQDLELQLASVELLYESGRAEDALKRIDAVITALPKAATARYWRARVLAQMHRTRDATQAAEEAVRLDPQLSQAHGLLIRLYQIEGRGKEAAEQAEWLRDYERRVKSR